MLSKKQFEDAKAANDSTVEQFADYAAYVAANTTTSAPVAPIAAAAAKREREEEVEILNVKLHEVVRSTGQIIFHVDKHNDLGQSRIWIDESKLREVGKGLGINTADDLTAVTLNLPYRIAVRATRRYKGEQYTKLINGKEETLTVENDGWNVTVKSIILPSEILVGGKEGGLINRAAQKAASAYDRAAAVNADSLLGDI